AADLAARFEHGAGGIDLDPGAVIVELEREEAARVGRELDRLAAHHLGESVGDALRFAGGDGQVMDHGFLQIRWRRRYYFPRTFAHTAAISASGVGSRKSRASTSPSSAAPCRTRR